MIGNALVRRYAVSALRPRHLWVNAGIYAIGLALIGMLNALALMYGTGYDGDTRLCVRSVYGQLLAIQFLLLWVWGGYNAGNALREEMLRKSYDFFRLLPLSPWQKFVGIVIGRNLATLALATVTAAVQLVLGLAGGVPLLLQAQVVFALAATTAMIWSVAVLSSVRPRRGKEQRATSPLLLIFLGLWVIPVVLQFVALVSAVAKLDGWTLPFFSLDLPGLLLVGAIAAYLAGWAAFGAMRGLKQAELTIFSRLGAHRFLAGCLVIVLGLFWKALTKGDHEIWFWYAALTHGLVVLLPFGNMRTYEQYMELTYALGLRHEGKEAIGRTFLAASNPGAWFGLYALWTVAIVSVAALQSSSLVLWALVLAACVFPAWSVLLLLAELAVVGAPRNEKLKFFAGFLAMLYLILPPLLAGVLNQGVLYSFSYVGIWTAVWKHASGGDAGEMMLVLPLLVNVMIAAVLVAIIRHRYQGLVNARLSMLDERNAASG